MTIFCLNSSLKLKILVTSLSGISIELIIKKIKIIMALPDESLDNIKPQEVKATIEKSSVNTKVLIIGIPVFIIQLIVIYFITANILVKKIESNTLPNNNLKTAQVNNVKPAIIDLGKFIYTLDDIIINPADTDGKRLLLVSIGFDVPKVEMENDLKTRDAMIKDVVISTLSSKNIDQLDNSAYRDTLKMEISSKLKKMIPEDTINNIYFSKYILQ